MSVFADIENKMVDNNQVIVVLGAHRSGTSALARSLQVLGVGLGDNLHPPGSDNPKGFWEDRDCVAINEQLLNDVGSEADRLGLAWDIDVNDPSIKYLFSKAVQLVSQSISKNKGVWGVKDPRMCRLLSFWNEVFKAADCNVNYIIALRDPLSAAKSLEKRNGMKLEKGYFLWLQHMVPAVLGSRGYNRLVVNYDLLLDSPENQIARMADCLKIPFNVKNNDLLMDFSRNFLDNNLRHNVSSLPKISSDDRIPYDVRKAYELLFRVAADELSIDSELIQAGFEQIQWNLGAYASAFTYANTLELEIERVGIGDKLSEYKDLIADFPENVTTGKTQLMINLVECKKEIENLKSANSILDARLTAANEQLAAANEQLATIYNSKAWQFIQKYRRIRSRIVGA